MKTITKDTEFIIGIDFGHGETSANFYSLKDKGTKDLDISKGKKVIKSAVAILEQEGVETIAVGDRAIQDAPLAKDFQVSFKKRPSQMNKVERKRMVAFMKGVYDSILDCYPDYRHRDHCVFIARPSQDKLWKSEEKAYIGIAEEAGLPVAGIQKESRAAYFRARTQPDSKIDTQVDNGVLIVDFGSSTIDFTYLNKDLPQPIDDGVDLGASAVEEALLKYSLAHPTDDKMAEFSRLYGNNEESNAYNQLLYHFRVKKEEFYESKLSNFSFSADFSLLTSAESTQLSGFGGITIPKKEVRRILTEEYNYIPAVEKAISDFKKNKLENCTVTSVYLTGGASRMDFVQEIFMRVFGLDEEHCPGDDHPELIVSQGVAHLSYADYQTQEKEKELREIANKIIDTFDWEGKLKEAISLSVKQSIIDKTYGIMSSYKDGLVYDMHHLRGGREGDSYYGPMEHESDGYLKVHNIESLIKKFESTFNGYVHYDFVQQCKSVIRDNVISSIDKELKKAFSAFKFEKDITRDFEISGLSARMSTDGANELKWKFTSNGEGHVIYDAVSSCYLAMVDWNKKKDRWDNDRSQHFTYYTNHYKNIFSDSIWNSFIKKYITIGGISSAKKQISSFVDDMITEFISYAKLTIFYEKKNKK